jgi:hypothetical protein
MPTIGQATILIPKRKSSSVIPPAINANLRPSGCTGGKRHSAKPLPLLSRISFAMAISLIAVLYGYNSDCALLHILFEISQQYLLQ